MKLIKDTHKDHYVTFATYLDVFSSFSQIIVRLEDQDETKSSREGIEVDKTTRCEKN
jgi:hypothetical protein